MRIWYSAVVIIACFIAAIAGYVFGIPAGGAIFLVFGLTFEGLLRIGLFGRKKRVNLSRIRKTT